MEKHNINLSLGSVQIVMSNKTKTWKLPNKTKAGKTKTRNAIFDKYNFSKIDTVHGVCENCMMPSILVGICSDFYRCTNCGHDTKQHVNGSIRYLKISERDVDWLKDNPAI